MRERVLHAAAKLIEAQGAEAATTRAVAAAAGTQQPVIYRLFGDKRGLIEAVAEYMLANYLADISPPKIDSDPLQTLREGWNKHVEFGLRFPDLLLILYTRTGAVPKGSETGLKLLKAWSHAVALNGALKVSEERAVWLLDAMAAGTALVLLRNRGVNFDPDFVGVVREVAFQSIMTGEPASAAGQAPVAAATLAAVLDQTTVLSPGEEQLLRELLDRIANNGAA